MTELTNQDVALVREYLPDSMNTADATDNEIRALQRVTDYAPREFVALVLYQQMTESEAATLMDIEVGTFRGKIGRVREKYDTAAATVEITDQIREHGERSGSDD